MAAADHAASSTEHYRRERAPCSREFGVELARITEEINDPVAKLRYLRGAIDHADEYRVRRLPCAPVRRALYRLRGLEALDRVIREHPDAVSSIPERTLGARRKARRVMAGAVVAGLLLVPALLAGLALKLEPETFLTQRAVSPQPTHTIATSPSLSPSAHPNTSGPALSGQPPQRAGSLAEMLPKEELGIVPTTIWLADRGPDWELYSNGLRIETTYATAAAPRRYRVHHRETGLQPELYSKPVGILFHTSESDLWPLEPAFGRQLRQSSAGLLRYVRDLQAYNYLIDRFGRVYRVIDDDSRANHAGHSVWARNDEIYLDLNAAFLGISFESRWDGGRTLPITRAQLIAGRNLTHYLRQRFAIAPEMCVTHGLTSVSPKQKLIGYHRDWARGFPFEAFGLPDLYAQPLPSVALFGFGHDDDFLRAVGERWPGLIAAERLLDNEAQKRSITVDALRRERQALYSEWLTQSPAGEGAAAESPAQQTADNRG